MPLSVSVALCTHNGARFVGEQVRSILAQTRLPFEVVVSDDASTDDTVAVIERMWALAPTGSPELRVIRNPAPLGVTANFEQAIAACRGALVALCDQDDSWDPERLERIGRTFSERPGLQLLFTDARLVDESGTDLGPSLFQALEVRDGDLAAIRGGRAFDVLLRRNIVTGATVVFRRELFELAAPFDPDWVHDEWLAIIAAGMSEVDWLPDRLVDYRQHGSNEIGVAVPTLRYKVGRVFEQGGDRHERLALRARKLRARLAALDAHAEVMAAADAKVAHQQRRAALPRLRIARVLPILREALTGRYERFSSQGRMDIVRDLLQPRR